MTGATTMDLKTLIKDVPDYPKKGIIFKDITPLLSDARAYDETITRLAEPWKGKGVQVVAGIESRGFLLAAGVALKLGAGLVPVRKAGKLPRAVFGESYSLEYGTAAIEAHQDAFPKGAQVLLVDDVLATGGTAKAALAILERIGGKIAGASFLIELDFLKGREKISGYDCRALINY